MIDEVNAYKTQKHQRNLVREFWAREESDWPGGGPRDIILKPDLALEFGSPETASVSFVLWTTNASLVTDQRITLIGKDVTETRTRLNPFGKVVIAGVKGFDETNAFDRNRQIHLKKFDLSLKGHMLRSASHYLAEWNRISKAAVKEGFSFAHLGSALIDVYKKLDYVTAAEVVFVTSSNEDVTRLYDIGNRCARMIQAMSKMVKEVDHDCSECSYQDICKDTDELRRLRDVLAQKKRDSKSGGRSDR